MISGKPSEKKAEADASLTKALAAILVKQPARDAHRFLASVLTEKELEFMEKRLRIAHRLDESIPYSAIQKELGVSAATVAVVQEMRKDQNFLDLMQKLSKEITRFAWMKKRF